MVDYEEDGFQVEVKNTSVPGMQWEAKIEKWLEGNEHPTFQYYIYGYTREEVLDNARLWIKEFDI